MEPPKTLLSDRRDLFAALVLLATGAAIYGQTPGFPFITFDDPGYVYGNAHVAQGLSWANWRWAWTSFAQSNWHPLTWLSLMLDAQLYGLHAGGYHLTNLSLHLLNTLLLFGWLRRATGTFWPSVVTALFFVAHPLHVESVAWITERKDVLSTFFCFLTLLAYTRYAQGGRRAFYWAALGWFALGLMAKPMLVTLPALLLLLDFWPLRRAATVGWRRLATEKLPFGGLAAASALVTVVAQRTTAMVSLAALPPGQRLAAALSGYGSYLQKTVWPVGLGIFYPFQPAASLAGPLGWGLGLGLVTAGAWTLRRRVPALLVGWGWFLGALVPVIGVVQVGDQAIADRYTYLPHVGLFIAIVWTARAAWRRWPASRPVWIGLTTASALVCVLLAQRQTAYWRSSAALYQHTAGVVPPSPRLDRLRADALVEAGRGDEATDLYLRLWRNRPSNLDVAIRASALLLQRGRNREVAEMAVRAGDDPAAPADLLNQFALGLARCGRADEATRVYRRCEERYPDYALARFGLADVLRARGDANGALAEDQAGLVLRDDWLPALVRLASGYAQSDDPQTRQAALVLAQRAVALSGGSDPASLRALARARAATEDWAGAEKAARAALAFAEHLGAKPEVLAVYQEELVRCRRHELPLPSVAAR